jgi:hypothetical protein
METMVRVLGEEHPSMLTSMNNLAFTWKERGRNVEAVKLMHECVQSRDECSFLNIYNCVQTLRWYEVDVPRSHSSTGVIHVQ